MDKELTKKITDSIKKKLKEIQGGVIAGLPDYVLVMTANKRAESQIAQDLKVFLGDNAPEFAGWLVKLLQELKYYVNDENKSKSVLVKEREEVEADEDILKLTEQEQLEADEPEKDDTELSIIAEEKDPFPPETDSVIPLEIPQLKKEEKVLKNDTPLKFNNGESVEKKSVKPKSKVTVTSSSDKEYDPFFPSIVNSSQSLPRKSSVPTNMQANKLLLLKAIDDANASVNGKEAINQIYKPTPIKVLTAENRKRSTSLSSLNKRKNSHERILEINDIELDYEVDDNIFWAEKNSKASYKNLLYPIVLDSEMDSDESMNRREVIINELSQKTKNSILNNSDDDEGYINRSISPRFVVTLDGIPDNFKRKRSFSDTSDKSGENEDLLDVSSLVEDKSMLETDEVMHKKQKILERCKFWPACKNIDSCEYYHPCKPCKLFPNCKYGDKCVYLHPNCKFDSRCTRKDCPYTHVSKRDFSYMNAGMGFGLKPVTPVSSPVCKFFPNCTVYPCPFIHPKKCRFGSECNTPHCQFVHQNYPSREQLKWKASLSA